MGGREDGGSKENLVAHVRDQFRGKCRRYSKKESQKTGTREEKMRTSFGEKKKGSSKGFIKGPRDSKKDRRTGFRLRGLKRLIRENNPVRQKHLNEKGINLRGTGRPGQTAPEKRRRGTGGRTFWIGKKVEKKKRVEGGPECIEVWRAAPLKRHCRLGGRKWQRKKKPWRERGA